jgi:cellulose biosynthesis protein BcsQ
MTYTTAAVVGAAGGVGVTRTTLETAVALAVDGADVAVFDAAYATQGLGDHLSGRLDPDLTTLLTDRSEAPLASGLVDFAVDPDRDPDVAGRVACCPTDAPFERIARAKTVAAARRLEERIEEAAATFDHVLVDVPPIAANQAVAAATTCERIALVVPPGDRGTDATGRLRARLADLGTAADVVAAVRTNESTVADVVLPTTESAVPACLADERYGRAVASFASRLLERDLHGVGDTSGLWSGVSERIRRR